MAEHNDVPSEPAGEDTQARVLLLAFVVLWALGSFLGPLLILAGYR